MSKNIVLTGLSGSGKTTIGKLLQKYFPDFELVDTDEIIVKKENRSINDIFATDGEEFFRNLETQTAKDFSEKNNFIISTGGGIVLREKNLEYLKKNGLIFYLKTTPETLSKRLKGKTDRPLLNNSDMLEKLKSMLEKRSEFYEKADIIIETDKMSAQDTAKEITRIYNERN